MKSIIMILSLAFVATTVNASPTDDLAIMQAAIKAQKAETKQIRVQIRTLKMAERGAKAQAGLEKAKAELAALQRQGN